jgi:hypothetical protein
MTSKVNLEAAILHALSDLGGAAVISEIARHIWEHNEAALRSAGDQFYTWQ